MKKAILLCIVSAILGAVLACAIREWPTTDEPREAQPPVVGQAKQPVPSQSVPVASSGLAAPEPAPSETSLPTAEVWPAQFVGQDGLTPEGAVNASVYRTANRSVVNITTESVRADRFYMIEIPSQGEGSGTVIDRLGHIVTNYHVIENARDIRVALFDGTAYEAKSIGHDPVTDVAVIKIDAPAELLHPVTFGDSTRLQVGQRVFAIGNPFGLERTLTTGIVSSLNRSIPSRSTRRKIKSIIQIDAAINPGNSGGPLLDAHSRMIGMNTAIASKTGESAGVGFAIPVNTIARMVPQLIQKGRVVRPEIGIARVFRTEHGLLIASLVPDGPAQEAGLRGFRVVKHRKRIGPTTYEYTTIDRSTADLIIGVDGKRVRTVDDLLSLIESKQAGDQVVVTVFRNGKEVPITVRLAAGE